MKNILSSLILCSVLFCSSGCGTQKSAVWKSKDIKCFSVEKVSNGLVFNDNGVKTAIPLDRDVYIPYQGVYEFAFDENNTLFVLFPLPGSEKVARVDLYDDGTIELFVFDRSRQQYDYHVWD